MKPEKRVKYGICYFCTIILLSTAMMSAMEGGAPGIDACLCCLMYRNAIREQKNVPTEKLPEQKAKTLVQLQHEVDVKPGVNVMGLYCVVNKDGEDYGNNG